MKNVKLIYLVAGLIAVSGPQLTSAEDAKKPEGRPNREELRKEFQNLTPEEREAKRKEFMEKMAKDLGLDPEELKKLPEEERRAKIKEAGEKKLTELQKKKADGTITDAEKETLQRMEQRKKMMEGQRGEGRPNRKPGAEKPSDK